MLYAHQKKFLEENPDKSALVWSCGTGKSRTACEWAKLGNMPTLVICPKALKTNWQREGKLWGAKLRVVSKEEFRRDHKLKDLDGFHQIIVDEVHNGFLTPNFKSAMSKSLRWFIANKKINRVLLLSATIYTSSPWNIYNLAYYCGHQFDWHKFYRRFFDEIRMGPRRVPIAKKGCEVELAALVRHFASVVDIHDVMDVPLQNHLEPEYFVLSKEQEKAIKEAYDPLPIVRYTKQHQIENGILIGNEFKQDEIYETDKIERIKALCEENKKIAIVCRYNLQIDQLKSILRDRPVFVIRGETPNRDKVCLEAESASEAVVLIQADCGVGFQLPSFELCIYASMSYSYTSWEQMNGRFLRMDKPSRTTFVYLLTEGDSIDQAIYDCIKKKEDFKIELYKK
jgi:superfamily II DNA or RNA helicase